MKTLNMLIAATLMLLTLSTTSCKKDEVASCTNGKQDGTETGIDCGGPCTVCTDNINEPYYFTGLVDGNKVTLQNSGLFLSGGGSYGNGSCILSTGSGVSIYDTNSVPTDNFSIDFRSIFTGDCNTVSDSAIFNHLFEVGTFNYGENEGPNGSLITVEMLLNNVLYSTINNGTQPQTSRFTILESTPIASLGPAVAVKLKIQLTCTLKSEAGDVIEITNAETILGVYNPVL